MVSGTIAPAREIPKEDTIQIILANLNLVVPIVAAVLVIIVAIIVICVLRGKGNYNKGTVVRFVFLSDRYDRAGPRLADDEDAVPVDTRVGRLEHRRAGCRHRCRCRCRHRRHLRRVVEEGQRSAADQAAQRLYVHPHTQPIFIIIIMFPVVYISQFMNNSPLYISPKRNDNSLIKFYFYIYIRNVLN